MIIRIETTSRSEAGVSGTIVVTGDDGAVLGGERVWAVNMSPEVVAMLVVWDHDVLITGTEPLFRDGLAEELVAAHLNAS